MKQLILILPCLFLFQTVNADCNNNRYQDSLFNFIVTYDIEYGHNPNSNTQLLLDLYEPENDTYDNRPVVIMIHGGSFVGGSKQSPDMVYMAERFAERGYVAASIRYSLGVNSLNATGLYRAVVRAVHDAKAAVRFFRKEAAENGNPYGIDPERIFIGGMSAGAITAIHAAYLDDNSNVDADLATAINQEGGVEGNSGNAGYSSAVSGVFNIAGAIGDTDWIEANDPPVVSVHADGDDTVPYAEGEVGLLIVFVPVEGSYLINERALDVGVPSDLYTYTSNDHAWPVSGAANLNTTFTFGADFFYDHVCGLATNVKEVKSVSSQLIVYPNPASEYLEVNLNRTDLISENLTYNLFDFAGREVVSGMQNSNNFQIEVNHLPAGIYLLNVTDLETGLMYNERVVVK